MPEKRWGGKDLVLKPYVEMARGLEPPTYSGDHRAERCHRGI